MRIRTRLRTGIIAAAFALGSGPAAWGQGPGQVLLDPTRPPPEWLAAQPKAPGISVEADAGVAPQLQSIVIGPSRRYAIIEGQMLGVGDTFKDARVVAVRPTGVVLRSEHGTQTLRLYPDVEKRPVNPVAAESAGAGAKAKRRVIRLTGTGNDVAKEKK